MSWRKLTLRLVLGVLLAIFILFLFYYLPSHFTTVAAPFVPQQYVPIAEELVATITASPYPLLGLALALFFFFDVLLSGTWAYGVILIVTGVAFIAYVALLFEEGSLLSSFLVSAPATSPGFAQSPIYSEIETVLVIFVGVLVISTLFSIGQGIRLVANRSKKMTA
jgi:hypothetical protein